MVHSSPERRVGEESSSSSQEQGRGKTTFIAVAEFAGSYVRSRAGSALDNKVCKSLLTENLMSINCIFVCQNRVVDISSSYYFKFLCFFAVIKRP